LEFITDTSKPPRIWDCPMKDEVPCISYARACLLCGEYHSRFNTVSKTSSLYRQLRKEEHEKTLAIQERAAQKTHQIHEYVKDPISFYERRFSCFICKICLKKKNEYH